MDLATIASPTITALATAITALLATILTLLAQTLILFVRLCCHKLITHTLVKYYLKKSLRVVNAHVQRTSAWERWVRRWWEWWARLRWWLDGRCRIGGGEGVVRMEQTEGRDMVSLSPPQLQRLAAESDPEHEGQLALVTALAAALDSVRHVVVGAEPPVTTAASRRPSIDEVVAGGLGGYE